MIGSILGGLVSSVVLKPFVRPLGYSKHWMAVAGALATLFGASFGHEVGITESQMQGFIAVVSVIAVNLIPNRG